MQNKCCCCHEHSHALVNDRSENGSCSHEHEHSPTSIQEINPEDLALASNTRAIYRIPNMDCPMEEALIRKKLASIDGIKRLQFNLMQRVLTVDHAEGKRQEIEAALHSIDMIPEALLPGTRQTGQIQQTSLPWKKLIWATALAAFSEIFELLADWDARPFGFDLPSMQFAGFQVTEIFSVLLALCAIYLAGIGTFRKGWLAISNFNLNINALMAVAVTGAVLIGQFPEAAMVMVLFNVSEAIEAKALDRARNAIKELLDLAPKRATVLMADGSWQERDLDDIAIGSRIRVRPGEKIALDGEVASGESAVNQAPITGESMPVDKKKGDLVYAGTINETGSLEFLVKAGANDTTLARIIHSVEEAQATRAPMQRFVDVFAKYYTPCVFLLALVWTVIPPLFFDASWHESIYTALVILVIGCPCALVISTPVTVVSGMAAATRRGILIKGGLYLEIGRKMNWLALDKTGTLTWGKPRLTNCVSIASFPLGKAQLLAKSIASRSDHPVSRAIMEIETNEPLLQADNFQALPGHGVSAVIDGQTWSLGNHALMEKLGKCSPEMEKEFSRLESEGKTVVALAGPDTAVAILAVADTVKPSSIEAVHELKKLGVKTMMLTGDNEHTARSIAHEVGADAFRANLLPQQKLEIIEKLEQEGNTTGMVGDGINDAPALAKANIGFAMAAEGTDTAIETADVALMDDDLRKIPRFIRLSRATHAILVENISLALGIKTIFFILTLTGHATMWAAVFADVGAALLVVANGLRILRK